MSPRPYSVIESLAIAVVQAQIDAYNARDLDKIVTYYAPDGVVRDAAEGRFSARGPEEIRSLFDDVFAANPDLHADTPAIFGVGEWVAAHLAVAGFRSGNEAPRARRWLEVYRVVGGLIHELNIYSASG
jgi:putative hydrolase of HD superfamily